MAPTCWSVQRERRTQQVKFRLPELFVKAFVDLAVDAAYYGERRLGIGREL